MAGKGQEGLAWSGDMIWGAVACCRFPQNTAKSTKDVSFVVNIFFPKSEGKKVALAAELPSLAPSHSKKSEGKPSHSKEN